MVRAINSNLFIDAINSDIKDIRARMAQKGFDHNLGDTKKSIDEDNLEITDIEGWLKDQSFKRKTKMSEGIYELHFPGKTLAIGELGSKNEKAPAADKASETPAKQDSSRKSQDQKPEVISSSKT